MKLTSILVALSSLLLASCAKVDDPFVDRVAAPVLIVVDNAIGNGGGLTTEPTFTSKAAAPVTMQVRIYELDKTNLLDYTKGIDSIPVASLSLKLTTRTGAAIADLTTDAKGVATLTRPWSDFGVATPRAGTTVALTLTGKHKEQAFAKLMRVQGVN